MNTNRALPVSAFFLPFLFLVLTFAVLAGSAKAVTNVSACGQTINVAGGYYVLNRSISSSSTCITISANNITLDCSYYGVQYNITGIGLVEPNNYGVYFIGRSNVTIKNCLITAFAGGIHAESSSNNLFLNNSANDNIDSLGNGDGFSLVSSSNNSLVNNTANNNNAGGFLLFESSDNNTIVNNTANGSPEGFLIMNFLADYSSNNVLTDNTANDVILGFDIELSFNNTIANNTANNTGYAGLYLADSSNNTITGNRFMTVGADSVGLYFEYWDYGSNYNVFSGNTVTTTGSGGSYAVYFLNSSWNSFSDGVLSASGAGVADVYVEGFGNYSFTNVSFNKSDTAFKAGATGGINVFWYANALVTDNNGNALSGAAVNASNVNGSSVFNATTNATGWIARQTVLEYYQNRTQTINYTPHWFNASKTGYFSSNAAVVVSENHVGAGAVVRALNLDCGTLGTANAVYLLNRSVSSAGTCFNVTAANVTLDCNGYGINYSSAGVGYGVVSTAFNTTVENCVFINQTGTSADSYGVYFQGVTNGIVFNNRISTSGTNGFVIDIESSSNNNVTNNTISASGSHGYGILLDTNSNNNTLTGNNVTTTGNSGYGIWLALSSNNNLTSDSLTISGSPSIGIYFWYSNSNVIDGLNLNMTRASAADYSAILLGNSTNNSINNSYIYTNYTNGIRARSLGPVDLTVANTVINVTTASTSYYDVVFDAGIDGTINFTNTTFNRSRVSFGAGATGGVNVFWLVDAHVVDNNGYDLSGAAVNAGNVNGSSVFNASTNGTGWIARQTVLEYWQNITGVFNYTPHWFNASLQDYYESNLQHAVSSNLVGGSALSIVLQRIPVYYGGGGGSTPTPAPTASATPAVTVTVEPSFFPALVVSGTPAPSLTASPSATLSESSVTPSVSVSGGVTSSQAGTVVSSAQALMIQAQSKGVDSSAVGEARNLLALAQQALQKGDYAGAQRYAEQAKSILNSKLVAAGLSSAAGFDWTLVAVVVLLVLVAGGAYWFYSLRRNKSR